MSSIGRLVKSDRRLPLMIGMIVVLAVAVVLVNFDISLPFVADGGIRAREEELAAAKSKLAELKLQLESPGSEFVYQEDVIIQDDHGNPRLFMWSQIEEIAGACGVTLRSRGVMQDSRIAEGIVGFELTIDVEAPLGNICNFLIELSQRKPRYFWDGITLKPSGGNVSLNGTLKVIVVTSPEAMKRLWGRSTDA